MTPVPDKSPAEYDLIPKMTAHLDPHFVYAMLANLHDNKGEFFKQADVNKCRLKILAQTNMLEFMETVCEETGEPFAPELKAKIGPVKEDLEKRQQELAVFLDLCTPMTSPEGMAEILGGKTIREFLFTAGPHLPESMAGEAFPEDVLDQVFDYAIIQYQFGNYSLAAGCLALYRNAIARDNTLEDPKKTTAAFWGLLAAHILVTEFDEACDILIKLSDNIDGQRLSKHEELAQRIWWLHWALFVIFRSESVLKYTKLIDMFLSDKNLQIISIAAPHLIRYVSYIAIVTKRIRPQLKDIAAHIDTHAVAFADPMAMFLKAVYVDMDFASFNKWLDECKKICEVDFFFLGAEDSDMYGDFEENARLLIFETFCRIHQEINIEMIANQLGMTTEDAEVWIVKLIQAARLDAKIDSEKNSVIMTRSNEDVYNEVLDKTKNLSFRSLLLFTNLEKGLEGRD